MGDSAASCPLCAEIASHDTATGNQPMSLAMADAHPVTEGHLLLVPTRHVERVTELRDGEWGDLTALIRQKLLEMEAQGDVDGVTVGINSGVAAGQTVAHAHVHLIPRRHGDCSDPRGGVRWVVERNADYWTSPSNRA